MSENGSLSQLDTTFILPSPALAAILDKRFDGRVEFPGCKLRVTPFARQDVFLEIAFHVEVDFPHAEKVSAEGGGATTLGNRNSLRYLNSLRGGNDLTRLSISTYQVLPAQQVVAIARIWHGARGEPEIPGRLEC